MSDDDQIRVQDNYGGNYLRLAEAKRRYDPDNLFCGNHNIDPGFPRPQPPAGTR